MNPRLLANENFPLPSVQLLRAAGFDVASVLHVMAGASDVEVLAFARREYRWILTFDRDYGDLVFRKGVAPPPAIIYLRQEAYSPAKPAELYKPFWRCPSGCWGVLLWSLQ